VRIRIICSILIISALTANNTIWAEEDAFDLGKIVITPSRLYQKYGQVSRATSLITEDEIEDKNPVSVGRLLRDLPSVHVNEYGSLGASSSVRMRGGTASQTLVLIDDMPLNTPRDGQVNLSSYEVENIERVEVVRGPSSSLYGSSAVSGTINIITKEGKTAKPETTISTRFGTFRTHVHEVTHGAKIGRFDYFLSASSGNTQGHRDNSKYQGEGYNGKIGYDIGGKHRIKISGRYHRSELGTPGSLGYFSKDKKQEEHQNYVNGVWESNFDDKLRLKAQGYMNLDRLEFIEAVYPVLDKTTHQSKNRSVNLQSSYTLFENYTLMAGVEGKKYLLNSTFSGKHDYISRSAYGLIDLHFFDMLDIAGGARIDDYTTFGSQVSPSVNGSLTFWDWKIRGSYAESYRVPTFNDLYWPTNVYNLPAAWWPIWGQGEMGDPDLNPETGKTYEVGIENIMDLKPLKELSIDTRANVTYFNTETEDLISWAMDSTDYYWRPSNVSKAETEGIEVEGEAILMKDIKATASYTFTKAKNKETKQYLVFSPRHKLDFSLQYNHPSGIKGRFHGQYSSSIFIDTANNVQVKPYWVFGTDLYYDIDEKIRYFVNIDNMTNRTYEKSKGYPMPGFSVMTGIRTKF